MVDWPDAAWTSPPTNKMAAVIWRNIAGLTSLRLLAVTVDAVLVGCADISTNAAVIPVVGGIHLAPVSLFVSIAVCIPALTDSIANTRGTGRAADVAARTYRATRATIQWVATDIDLA